jgi:serine/threonine-protein kinase HipA
LTAERDASLFLGKATLSEDGRLLVVKRFNLVPGADADTEMGKGYLGFEEFCVLQGKQGARKYMGSYQ